MRQIFILVAAIILAILMIDVGLRLLQSHTAISSTWYVVLALASILGGVLAVSARFRGSIIIGVIFLLIGALLFARAGGVYHEAWMPKIFGILLIGAAGTLIFISLPFIHPIQNDQDSQPQDTDT